MSALLSGRGFVRCTHGTVRRYIFYCMIAISFGTLSAWIVKSFAPYAQGAGIPEIKVPPRGPPLQRLLLKLPSLSFGSGLRDFYGRPN